MQALDRRDAVVEQAQLAAELVDQEAADERALGRLQHRLRADQARDDAAAVDVAGEQHRHVGGGGEAHIGDVAGAQVDLGRAARALDQHDVGIAREPREALEHRGQQVAPRRR